MNSVDRNIPSDFEPREVPKPAPRFDSPPVPSVPEVSLVFDKPAQDAKTFDYNIRKSPSIDKYDSYATWKQTALLSNGHAAQKPRHSVGSALERSQSHSNANQLHKNVLANESLRHSRSDPSLTRKIDVLSVTQGYEREFLEKVTQNRQPMSPNRDNMQRSNSHEQFESNFRFPEGERQHFLQERNRDSYGDKERQQIAQNSAHKNDERHSTRVSNSKNRQQQAGFDPRHSNYDPSSVQKLGVNQFAKSPNRLQADYMNPALQNGNYHSRNSNSPNFHPNMFPRYHQFPPYCDSDYGYPFPPHPYSPNIQSQRNENEETVKNLLQLINNQSEQIKSLQSQVERLLKIQEESLKDREKCNCSRNLGLVNENYEQNTQFSIQTTNNNPVHSSGSGLKLSRDDSTVSQRHNATVERNMIGSTNIKEMKKNLTCDYSGQNHEGRSNATARDEQLKNKILEQKVSIGVMTSFEFTVQNNPFAQETEVHRPYYGATQTEIDQVYSQNGNEDVSEQGDVSRTCQNVFSRVSNQPLENIIEDSESHLSVSQQPSSNFHSSPTIDEFKSSEPGNRKITKNASVGKILEANPTFFNNKNSEDTQDHGRENYSSNQRRQLLDIQEHFKDIQRSESPKRHDIISATQSPCTDNLPKHYYSETNTPGRLERRRQDTNDQNRTDNKNIHSPITHKLSVNGREQYNQQKESNSPYRFEDQQNPNATPGGRDASGNGYGNTSLLARTQEPRSQQSPVAYVKERNRMLSRPRSSQENCIEESIVLNSGELEINEQPPPSPEPSIHVEMQEYSSDEESDKHGGEGDKQTPKVGWTFYNNVLGQVNQILQNTPITRNSKEKTADKENMEDLKNKATAETVKIATMEQLRKLGISFVEKNDSKDASDTSNKNRVTFDSSYYPRLEYRGNMTQATSTMSETDTSMHMNALALKYLSDEQLGELALQKHSAETLKQLMVSNVQGTNMSFATMRYLERYQLLPTNNNPQVDDERRILERPRPEELRNAQRPPSSSQMARMSCPSKILDISTLKQQPKLL